MSSATERCGSGEWISPVAADPDECGGCGGGGGEERGPGPRYLRGGGGGVEEGSGEEDAESGRTPAAALPCGSQRRARRAGALGRGCGWPWASPVGGGESFF